MTPEQRMQDDGDYLRACRRVLAAGIVARARAELLAIAPERWPGDAATLRTRLAAAASGGPPEAELEMLDPGHDVQRGLATCLDLAIGTDDELSAALLQLQLDGARVRFVFEETAMRLRGDAVRYAHAAAHGWLLKRLTEVKVLLRMRRHEEARAALAAFRAAAHEHVRVMDAEPDRGGDGGG